MRYVVIVAAVALLLVACGASAAEDVSQDKVNVEAAQTADDVSMEDMEREVRVLQIQVAMLERQLERLETGGGIPDEPAVAGKFTWATTGECESAVRPYIGAWRFSTGDQDLTLGSVLGACGQSIRSQSAGIPTEVRLIFQTAMRNVAHRCLLDVISGVRQAPSSCR